MLQPDTGAQNTNYRQGSVDSPVQALAVARVAEGDNRRVDSMVTPRLSQVIKLQSHQVNPVRSPARSKVKQPCRKGPVASRVRL